MNPEITETMDYRSFDFIVQGRTSYFTAIEIRPVREHVGDGHLEGTFVEPDHENPSFFSVYLRMQEGGVMCIGDHGTHALALAYAQELATDHGWEIQDLVPVRFHASANAAAPWRLSPERIRQLMRQNGKTIRALAREMNITMTRVRQVRSTGVSGKVFCQDWMEALTAKQAQTSIARQFC